MRRSAGGVWRVHRATVDLGSWGKLPSPLWGEEIKLSLPFGERVRVRGRNKPAGSKMKRPNIDRCRDLRKNQTDAERKLWSILRNRQLAGTKFRRQFAIGRYILDFYSPEYKLGIEADGGQHYEDKGRLKDEQRSKELSQLGVEVIRFSDRDILNNMDGVYRAIQENIEKKRAGPSHLNPAKHAYASPRRGEEMKFSLPFGERVKVRGKIKLIDVPSPLVLSLMRRE